MYWRFLAPALCAIVSLIPLASGFSSSRIFYLRDLTFAFWPVHQWFRNSVYSGESPLWDPYVAFGQSAIADPVRQILFPPTLLLRLLLPTTIGFNATVALAFPTAAVGMYLALRRRVSIAAAALGACIFALSGPVLSTGNMLNVSWSAALIPWVLWATDLVCDRASGRTVATLAVATALQFLAGEPVTLAVTLAVAAAYTVVAKGDGSKEHLVGIFAVGAGIALGLLLCAIQLLPLVDATSRSVRGEGFGASVTSTWAIHPLSLLETILPGFFGDPWSWTADAHAWLYALNGGRDPFLFSLYYGAGAIGLAACGAVASRRRKWALFWCAILFTALVCALGDSTPIYPTIQALVPPIRSFRIPSKYLVLVSVAIAALAALGWDSLDEIRGSQSARARRPARIVAVLFASLGAVALCALLASLLVPVSVGQALEWVARTAGLANPAGGVSYLFQSLDLTSLRLAALSATCAGSLWLAASRRREARLAAAVLFGAAVLDPLIVNANVNPTTETARLARPSWTTAMPDLDDYHVYVGGRFTFVIHGEYEDMDNTPAADVFGVQPYALPVQFAIDSTRFATFPSGFGVRDSVSIDNTALWPREYTTTLKRLKRSSRAVRSRFLTRASVRYFVTPVPPSSTARMLEPVRGGEPFAVYEEPGASPRVEVVDEVEVFTDVGETIERLTEPTDEATPRVFVDSTPEPSGIPGEALESAAKIDVDRSTFMQIDARAPAGGGYLIIRDSFSPYWRAEVDGAPAPIVRADALFRAIRLEPGRHRVHLVFRPTPFYSGAAISTLTALLLAGLALRSQRWQGTD